jgi:hypothetical protein
MVDMETTREDQIDRQLNNLSEKIDNRVSRIEDKVEREIKYLKRSIDIDNTYLAGRFEARADQLLSEIQQVLN